MNYITISYQNAALTSANSSIQLHNGTFGLAAGTSLNMSGTLSFSSLSITTGQISFNVPSGTTFNANVQAPVVPGASDPMLDVTNFSGIVMVTWPTVNGPQTQELTSGNQITLNGYNAAS